MISRSLILAGAAVAAIGLAAPVAGGAELAPAKAKAAAPAFKPTRFSVVVKGSGPDVILIPGLNSSRSIWNGTVAAVPGYRYHLVHVAGFAGEPAGGNARGAVVAGVADEIARYIAASGLKRPAVIGHSMGGTVTMMVAARHPQLVGRAMVVDMLPQPAGLVGYDAAGVRPLADALAGLASTEDGQALVGAFAGLFGGPIAEDRRSDNRVVARATHELALLDLTPELGRIKAPLTVVYAGIEGADRVYPAAYARKPGARLVRVANSGHAVMLDQPQAFQKAVREFLDPR